MTRKSVTQRGLAQLTDEPSQFRTEALTAPPLALEAAALNYSFFLFRCVLSLLKKYRHAWAQAFDLA